MDLAIEEVIATTQVMSLMFIKCITLQHVVDYHQA